MDHKKLKSINKKYILKQLLWLLPGPVFYGLFRLSFLCPQFTETVYSRNIFRIVNQALSTVTGMLPFSLAEMLFYVFVLFVAVFIILAVIRSIMVPKEWWNVLLRRVMYLLSVFSIIYALFIGLWGFNYARQPLGHSLGLDTSPSTVSELYETCESLIAKANNLRNTVPENERGIFAPDVTKEDFMQATTNYYNNASRQTGYAFLSGSFGRAKPVIYSTGLSYADITGFYFPFTGEANVNADVPMLLFSATTLHEAAHQHGFSREDEANFLAYYVASYSGNTSVEYSGTMLALIHTMNKLYKENSDLYFELRKTYSDGLDRDFQNNAAYWQQFESPVGEVSQTVNNTFLQANQQKDGVKSYGRMVDLLIGLWRAGELA